MDNNRNDDANLLAVFVIVFAVAGVIYEVLSVLGILAGK